MKNIFLPEFSDLFPRSITLEIRNILNAAENEYGKRDHSFTILGVELTQIPYPHIWFPYSDNDIIIRITEDCLNDMGKAIYQTSHEIIHCLSPCRLEEVTFLEEGLATHFSSQYMLQTYNLDWYSNNPRYYQARQLVEFLLSIDSSIIMKVRLKEPTISKITRDLILQTNENVPPELALLLTSFFNP